MFELIHAGKNTYYIESPVRVGIYNTGDGNVFLYDTGSSKDMGRRILRIVQENGWNVRGIINSHAHADHTGGNNFVQQRTGCPVYASETDPMFLQEPEFEPAFLFGGKPSREIKCRFLMAKPSSALPLREDLLPEGLSILPLPGHTFHMVGMRTKDDVLFLADLLTSAEILQKYHVSFLYDIHAYLETLTMAESLEAQLFVLSHAAATENIQSLIQLNRNKVYEIAERLLMICKSPQCTDEIIRMIFTIYGMKMDFSQYVLVGSTLRSYLTYLHEEGQIDVDCSENMLRWKTI